jgi:hypothetical protein
VHTLRSVFVNSPIPKPEVILTNFFAEPTVLLVPITSRDFMTLNRTLCYFNRVWILFRTPTSNNSLGSVFCVLCNRHIKYKINTVNYVNMETFLIYTYIFKLIFRWRWRQQKCDRFVINRCWGRLQSKLWSRYYILYKLRVLTLKEQKQQVIQI